MPDSPRALNAPQQPLENAQSVIEQGVTTAANDLNIEQDKAVTIYTSELSDSDSETLDVSRIIQSSNALRDRLSHFLGNQRHSNSSGSDGDSVVVEVSRRPANGANENLSSELSTHSPEVQEVHVGWNPPFLANDNVPDVQPGKHHTIGNK
ncbi:hypothetical protein IW145_002497 [Coemansia sp. RSA 521]|nr:hypothetical protein IW145_002497 [Coemansia sp. RSA 521]